MDPYQYLPLSIYGLLELSVTTHPRIGTSMSTPIVAGLAALVRQYFKGGWYAEHAAAIAASLRGGGGCLESYTCTNISASGSLVKAILVNSARGLKVKFI